MKKEITWLHFSDIHVCNPRTSWDYEQVLNSFISDLKRMEKQYQLRPDLIFFTGDAAFGQISEKEGENLADQFEIAEKMFKEVRTTFSKKVPIENFFIVPGNHDINRKVVTVDQTEWLDKQETCEEILRLIHSTDIQWQRYMERLSDYSFFLEKNGYNHLLGDPKRLIYALIRNVGGIKVGIGGFNSAWSCGRDGEKGKLWLGGAYQIGEIKNNLKEANFYIGIVHHPTNWLTSYEDPAIGHRVEQDFLFHLHGHEHDAWVHEGKRHIRIATGACYERSDKENGYNFVRLNLEDRTGEVWLRRYDSYSSSWVPRIIGGERTNNDGLWRLSKIELLPHEDSKKVSSHKVKIIKQQATAVKEIWDFGEENPSIVNIVAADTRRRQDLPDKTFPDYVFMEFLGDKDSVVEVTTQIARLYPDASIARYSSSDFPQQSYSTPIVSVGGPCGEEGIGGNKLTEEITNFWKMPISYTEDVESLVVEKKKYKSEYDEKGNLKVDYGVIARVPNPWHPQKRILIFHGIHTSGVLGATLAMTNSVMGQMNAELICKICGVDPLFFSWCKVSVITGTALAPKMEQKNITPLKL